jgi:hypothetical protein
MAYRSGELAGTLQESDNIWLCMNASIGWAARTFRALAKPAVDRSAVLEVKLCGCSNDSVTPSVPEEALGTHTG